LSVFLLIKYFHIYRKDSFFECDFAIYSVLNVHKFRTRAGIDSHNITRTLSHREVATQPYNERHMNRMYVNDISRSISCSTIKLFADDTNLIIYGKSVEDLQAAAMHEIIFISEWFLANKLS